MDGTLLGRYVGIDVGCDVGNLVGTHVGSEVGTLDGTVVGRQEGTWEGEEEGRLGMVLGTVDGGLDGADEGTVEGWLLGAAVPLYKYTNMFSTLNFISVQFSPAVHRSRCVHRGALHRSKCDIACSSSSGSCTCGHSLGSSAQAYIFPLLVSTSYLTST